MLRWLASLRRTNVKKLSAGRDAAPSESFIIGKLCNPRYRAFAGTHFDNTELGASERGIRGPTRGTISFSEGATLIEAVRPGPLLGPPWD